MGNNLHDSATLISTQEAKRRENGRERVVSAFLLLVLGCAVVLVLSLFKPVLVNGSIRPHIVSSFAEVTKRGLSLFPKNVFVMNTPRNMHEKFLSVEVHNVLFSKRRFVEDVGTRLNSTFTEHWRNTHRHFKFWDRDAIRIVGGPACPTICDYGWSGTVRNNVVEHLYGTSPPFDFHHFYTHTSPLPVYHKVALSLDSPQGKPSQESANYSQPSQNPIGGICRSDSSFQILFGVRLVISVSLCIGSIFLFYFGSRKRWCRRLGISGLGLGLLLLLAPVQWEWFLCSDQQQHGEQREAVHRDGEKVAQQVFNEPMTSKKMLIQQNFDCIALVLRPSGTWPNPNSGCSLQPLANWGWVA